MPENYLFPVGIDPKSEGFTVLNGQIDALEKSSKEAGDAMAKDFQKAGKAADDLDRSVKNTNTSLGQTTNAARTLEKEIADIGTATKSAVSNEPVNRFRQAWQGVQTMFRTGSRNVKDFFQGFKQGVNEAIRDAKRFEAEAQRAAQAGNQARDSQGRFTAGSGRAAGSGLSGNLRDIVNFATGGVIANGITGILTGIKNLGSEIITTAGKFQRFEAILRNAFGSSGDAQQALRLITDFAATTPFGVDEITEAFIKLVNRGFTPTKKELTEIGDLAASQGKSLDQLVEAILDAQTGEFERLKEFGIRARAAGDNVVIAFRGIEKQIKKTDEEGLRNAILSFGRLQGVAGSMAAVSLTLEGRLSNLGDTFSAVFKNIGSQSSGVLNTVVGLLQDFADVLKDVTEVPFPQVLREQQAELNALVLSLANTNENEQLRSRIISEISAKYPEFIKLIDLEKASNDQLLGVLTRVNQEYETKIRLAALDDKSSTIAKQQADLFNDQLAALEKIGPQLQAIGVTTADFFRFDKAKQDQVIEQAINSAKTKIQQLQQQLPSDPQMSGARAQIRRQMEDLDAQLKQLQNFDKTFTDLTKQQAEVSDIRSALIDGQKKANADALKAEQLKLAALEAQLKATKGLTAEQVKQRQIEIDAQKSIVAGLQGQVDRDNGVVPKKVTAPLSEAELKKIEAANRKAEELARKQNEQLIKLAQQLRDSELAIAEDGYAKQQQAIENSFKKRIEDIQSEKALTTSAEKAKADLIVALTKERDAQLQRLRLEQIRKEAELQQEAAKIIADLQPQNQEAQIAAINAEFDARAAKIKERFKDEADLRDQLLKENEAARNNAVTGVGLDAKLIDIDRQEKEALQSLELLKKYGNNTVKQERAIQQQILKVKIDAQTAILNALIAAGKAETDQQVINARNLLNALQAEFDAATNQVSNEKTDIFDLFGLDMTESEKEGIVQSFQIVMDSLTSIWENSLQRQLDLKQQQIDLIDEQIATLEEQFEKEKALADEGLANNMAVVQAELDAKQAAREQEQRQLDEIRKKQNKAAQAQIAVNGILQLSNLALSATQIFSAHSGIPFVGVAFAIAAVATMFATFAAMKAKAAELSKPQTFREGGPIRSGKDHAQGGIKYYSDNGDVKELEVGEYVVNRKSAKKYPRALEAINRDKWEDMQDFALDMLGRGGDWLPAFLEGTGVSMPDDKRREVLNLGRSVSTRDVNIKYDISGGDGNGKRLDKIEGHLAYLAQSERTRPAVHETETHIVTVRPHRITRKRKK